MGTEQQDFGSASERVEEANRKAFAAEEDTQDAARSDSFDVAPDPAAEGVGESTTRRGEDIVAQEGKEPGRDDAGTKGASQRPVGTSTGEDSTQVAASEPVDEDSPTMPFGDQGG